MYPRKFASTSVIFSIVVLAGLILFTGCGPQTGPDGQTRPTFTPASASGATAQPDAPGAPETSAATTETSSTAGSVIQGQIIFTGAGACGTCHTVNGSGGLIGPDLVGAAASAQAIHPDLSVEEALEIEIIDPDRHITEGYRGGLMPQNYEDILTPQQIHDLIAYMISLG